MAVRGFLAPAANRVSSDEFDASIGVEIVRPLTVPLRVNLGRKLLVYIIEKNVFKSEPKK